MNRKYAACDYTRSAPSYFASSMKFPVSQKATIRCCVRIPLRAFRRFRRICRGPGWDSTVPWFDRQLQVELQGFGLGEMTISVRPFLSFRFARWRMILGSPADIKDQPASPQPSPRPAGEGKVFFGSTQSTPSGTMKPK